MTDDEMGAAFNEWMRQYIEEPGDFEREWQTIDTFRRSEQFSIPAYGAKCTVYLKRCHEKLSVAGGAVPPAV